MLGREGMARSARDGRSGEKEVQTVEVDAAFGRFLGLAEGMKVRV